MTDTNKVDVEPCGYVDDYNSSGYYTANTPKNTYKTLKPVVPASALAALRQENEKLKKVHKNFVALADEMAGELRTQLAEAQAHNQRLREALEKFMLCCDFESPTDEAYFIATDTFSELWNAAETAARAALNGDV